MEVGWSECDDTYDSGNNINQSRKKKKSGWANNNSFLSGARRQFRTALFYPGMNKRGREVHDLGWPCPVFFSFCVCVCVCTGVWAYGFVVCTPKTSALLTKRGEGVKMSRAQLVRSGCFFLKKKRKVHEWLVYNCYSVLVYTRNHFRVDVAVPEDYKLLPAWTCWSDQTVLNWIWCCLGTAMRVYSSCLPPVQGIRVSRGGGGGMADRHQRQEKGRRT